MKKAEKWFDTDKISEDTFVISEYGHWEETHCYLLLGSKRAMLIDTGLGIGNISDEIKKLTDKPVFAVATHAHWDHIGGHKYYPEFYIHREEEKWITEKFPIPLEAVRNMVVKDCLLPEEFDIEKYEIFKGKPAGFIDDRDVIDLGNRKVKVLHTPGHSPGHLCFFEEERGWLFSGDLVYKGMLFADYPSTDPLKYFESLKKIEKLAVKKIFPGHHSMEIKPEIIKEMCAAFEKLYIEGKLCHKSGVFDYRDWSIKL